MFNVIHTLNSSQLHELIDLYHKTWWGQTRSLSEIQKMIDHSDIIIGITLNSNQKLVGFTRILTDYTYRAVIWDVIVNEDYQGQGLGKMMINSIINHPDLQEIEAFLLVCRPDIVPFYEQLGFSESQNLSIMIKSHSFN